MKWLFILMILLNCINNKVAKNESDNNRNVLLPFIFSDSTKNNCLTKTTVLQYEEKQCQQ